MYLYNTQYQTSIFYILYLPAFNVYIIWPAVGSGATPKLGVPCGTKLIL